MGNVLQTQPNPQLTEGNPVVASLMIRYIVGGSLPEHLTVMCFAALPSVGHTVMVPVVLTMSDQPPVWYSGRVGEVRWTWHQHYESMIPELILDTVFAWLDDDPDRGPLPVCARCRKQPLGERGCSSYEGDHPKKPNLESNVCYPCGVEVASLTKKKPESPL